MNAQACAHWLKVVPPAIEEAAASVDRIVRDARAVDAVMRNVRLLFNRQPVVKLPHSMDDLIKDAVSLIRADANLQRIPVEFDFGELELLVLADRFQIQQVLINLVGNAMEAMQVSDRTPSLRISVKRMGDAQVLTEFIDNGCGLPVHTTSNISMLSSRLKRMGWASDSPYHVRLSKLMVGNSGRKITWTAELNLVSCFVGQSQRWQVSSQPPITTV